MKRTALILLLLLLPVLVQAQPDFFRVCVYNVLNADGEGGPAREEHFALVLEEIDPDILVLVEIVDTEAADFFLTDLLGDDDWDRSDFTPAREHDVVLYYRSELFNLEESWSIPTDLRDIEVYRLSFRGDDRPSLYIAGTHLKASRGNDNEQRRLEEVEELIDFIAEQDLAEADLLFCGDFNFYDSAEDGYQALLEDDLFRDPIDTPGRWHDNRTFASVHTQSPRTEQFGGGASGGLDDRFDFILATPALFDGEGWDYSEDSYTAFGNDGEHFDMAINEGPNGVVDDEVADALHDASDHLPVYCELIFVGGDAPSPFSLLRPADGDTVWSLDTVFAWEQSYDRDTRPHYDVLLDTLADLSGAALVGDSITDTTFQAGNLEDNRTFYWTVRATDTNTPGTWANDTLCFHVYHPDPPDSFSLLYPDSGATFSPGRHFPLTFRWEPVTDPDPGDMVTVTLELADNPGFHAPGRFIATRPGSLSVDTLEDDEYWWRVVSVDRFGLRTESNSSRQLIITSSMGEKSGSERPGSLRIEAVYPVPFNSRLTVEISVPAGETAWIGLYNLGGRLVREVECSTVVGRKRLSINAEGLASGVYFLSAASESGAIAARKVVLLR